MPVDPASAGIDNNPNGIFLAIFPALEAVPLRAGLNRPAFQRQASRNALRMPSSSRLRPIRIRVQLRASPGAQGRP